MTRVILVDDHTLFRETLRRLLESEKRYAVVEEFASGIEANQAIERGVGFDLALIDYQLSVREGPEENGLGVLEHLRRRHPHCPVLMVTAGMKSSDLLQVVREMRVGVFLKSEPAAELLLAMEKTLRGELWISSGAALSLLTDQGNAGAQRGAEQVLLTGRERSVLRRILEGQSNKEIGAQISLSESLIKSVVQKLFEKFGVRSRSQLVRIAVERQLEIESAE